MLVLAAVRLSLPVIRSAAVVLPALLLFSARGRVRTRPEVDADVVASVFRDMLSDDRKPFALTASAVRPGAYTQPQAREAVVAFTDLNQSAANNRSEVRPPAARPSVACRSPARRNRRGRVRRY